MVTLREQIAYPKVGSNVYAMLSKIAFNHYLRGFSECSDDNWLRAESDLENWLRYQGRNHPKWTTDVEGAFHELLNVYAHQIMSDRVFCMKCKEEGSAFDDWVNAQNNLAQQIMHVVTRIPPGALS